MKKRMITYNIPYRLQTPLMDTIKGKEWDDSEGKLIERISQEQIIQQMIEEIEA